MEWHVWLVACLPALGYLFLCRYGVQVCTTVCFRFVGVFGLLFFGFCFVF